MVWSRIWKCLCSGFRIARVERGVRVVRELLRSKRRLLVAAVLCVVLVAGLAILWHGGHVAEAAVLYPHPGLVGWWRFDEGNGSVAKDSSGFGNDGTVYGATWVDGKYGKALSFDGTNDYVEVPDSNSLDISDAITVSWWHKANSWSHTMGIMGKYNVFSFAKRLSGPFSGLYTNFRIGGSWHGFYDYGDFPLNEWTFMVYTYDSATHHIKYYQNGSLTIDYEVTGLSDYHLNTSNYSMLIGKELLFRGPTFDGIIDEARIYNRALSADEIETLFQKGPDFSSRLLAKVPNGTTQFIVTLSWKGVGSINITIESPSKNYTEDMVPMYQKTVYSTSGGDMLNIKRLVVSLSALSSDENWYIVLKFDNVDDYSITVEVQR
jgi:hypothetical protein